ncbi:MAG: cytochrome c-type biogenesis protein [Burkholderiales bacterium]
MRALLVGCLLAWMIGAAAADTAQPLAADPRLEQRLNALSAELRCLVCQNQSLADSHADLAIDLKNQVREMMRAGKSDEEIKAYLTQRYGDFVLYRPPVKGSTWLLWAGPFALLLVAVGGLVWIVRRRKATLAGAPTVMSEQEQARIRALLDESDSSAPHA